MKPLPASLPTVREAIRIARMLDAPERSDALMRAFALEHGMTPAREDLIRLLRPALERVHLPALEAWMAAVLRGTESGPDLIALAGAYATLRPLVTGGARPGGGLPVPAVLADAVRHRADRSSEALRTALESADFPDLSALSYDLLRLEGLRWVVETLGDRRLAGDLAHRSRRVARVALRRATATIDAFLLGRDLLTLYDNASVVAQVDNLLVVVLRLLDALAAEEEQRTAFVETADEQALDAFSRALGQLSETLLTMLDKAAARPERGGTFFRSLVRQAGCVRRLCAALRAPLRPARLEAVQDALEHRLLALEATVAAALERAEAERSPALPAARVHAEELSAVLREFAPRPETPPEGERRVAAGLSGRPGGVEAPRRSR